MVDGLSDYVATEEAMRLRATEIAAGNAPEAVWLVEHPALFTAGTSAKDSDLLDSSMLPVHRTGRGGQFTYHGPGQRVGYVMLDLNARGRDIRCFVQQMESWIIGTLAEFNITAQRHVGLIGVWVPRPERGPLVEEKIAAIGVRVSRWVSWHGFSLNISPDLSHYSGIVPCGISDKGITSLEDLGQLVTLPEVDMVLRRGFEQHFGPTLSSREVESLSKTA